MAKIVNKKDDDNKNEGKYGSSKKRTSTSISTVPLDQFASFVTEIQTISEQKDATGIAYAVIDATSQTLKCDRSSFFFVDGDYLDLVIAKGVDSIRMPKRTGFAGQCATKGEIVNIPDAYNDKTFNSKFDKINNYHTKQVLCVPVKGDDETIGVLQCINKNDDKPFNSVDEIVLNSIAHQVGVSIKHCLQMEAAKIATKQKNALLSYIRSMKSNNNVASLLYTLNEAAQQLLEADRCTFYTINHEAHTLHLINTDAGIDIVLKLNQGIAGSVATSGVTVNIPDCYKDKRFDPSFDKKTHYHTKCMLVMPVFAGVNRVKKNEKPIAVVQLINKQDNEEGIYTKDDEDLLTVLLRFIGPLIKDSHLFKRKDRKKEFPKSLKAHQLQRHPSREIKLSAPIDEIAEMNEDDDDSLLNKKENNNNNNYGDGNDNYNHQKSE